MENSITCPECKNEINVNEVLYQQLHGQIKKEYESNAAVKDKEIQAKQNELSKAQADLRQEKEKLNELIDSEAAKRLKNEKAKLETSLRNKIKEETEEQFQQVQKELQEKTDQIKDLNKTKAEVERLKREKDELKDSISLEKEKEFNQKLKSEQERIKQQVEEANNFKIKEREKIINDLKDQLDEAKRKAEQGSIQLQGEIQELEIQKMLTQLYPTDEIVEIKKGQRGADILQEVKNNSGILCGKIYYESKRTKNFDNAWLQKLRDDNVEVKADIMVIVTEAMPPGVDRFIQKDKVWICSYKDIKGLSYALRYALMEVHSVAVTQHGKESKMEMLYNFLTSQEFKVQFEAIIEGFSNLRNSHNSEKLKMQRMWKEREKNMEKILLNTVNLYGSLKGIAGSSIPNIQLLEDENDANQLDA